VSVAGSFDKTGQLFGTSFAHLRRVRL